MVKADMSDYPMTIEEIVAWLRSKEQIQSKSRLNLNQMADASIQTALAVGVPTLAVLVGMLVNSSRLNDLRSHMDARFDDMRETLHSGRR